MHGISKRFPGVQALRDVALAAQSGEVHVLLGENGAGKSTLVRILAGACAADSGTIEIDGAAVEITSPLAARRAGISIVHQELALAPNLSVYENLFLGQELKRFCVLNNRRAMIAQANDVLARLRCCFPATIRVALLSAADQQLVEIARSMLGRAKILVLDEPTTSLSERETEALFTRIAHLKSAGLAIIYISHRMHEIDRLADRVTVLRDGEVVGTVERAEARPENLIRMMIGRNLGESMGPHSAIDPSAQHTTFTFRDYADRQRRRVKGCSFQIRSGEVLGIAGLVGSGRTELARLIFGADRGGSGSAMINATPLKIAKPADALAAGIAYLPEDRRRDGLFLDMSVASNLTISIIAKQSRAGCLRRERNAQTALALIRQLGIKTASADAGVASLSGGNQQKTLIGRLLATELKLLLLDEPTRGVDIGAKREIYTLIRALAAHAVAVIVISSELPEIVGLSDRVMVMREGLIVGEIDPARGDELNEENILRYAFHTNADLAA
jgi:ribose transport system ATP-binding protein